MSEIIIETPRRKREAVPVQIRVFVAGRNWSGDWTVCDGEICIRSAYGSRRCKVGRRKPKRLAEELMFAVLREWCGLETAQ